MSQKQFFRYICKFYTFLLEQMGVYKYMQLKHDFSDGVGFSFVPVFDWWFPDT